MANGKRDAGDNSHETDSSFYPAFRRGERATEARKSDYWERDQEKARKGVLKMRNRYLRFYLTFIFLPFFLAIIFVFRRQIAALWH